MDSHRRFAVSRQTNSVSTTCLAVFGNGLKIAEPTIIGVHRPMAVLGKAEIVVGGLGAAVPIAFFRRSFARPPASGQNHRAATTAAGSAWPELINDRH